jgi:hypothetical protein
MLKFRLGGLKTSRLELASFLLKLHKDLTMMNLFVENVLLSIHFLRLKINHRKVFPIVFLINANDSDSLRGWRELICLNAKSGFSYGSFFIFFYSTSCYIEIACVSNGFKMIIVKNRLAVASKDLI